MSMESSTAPDTIDSKLLGTDQVKWNRAHNSPFSDTFILTPDTQPDIEDVILDYLEAMERKRLEEKMSKSPYRPFPKLAYFLEVCYSTSPHRVPF